jgi:hypothetical protein
VQLSDVARYALWGAIAATAYANREEYHMSTTWLPHLLTNTLTLFLPDIYRVVQPPEDDAELARLPPPLDDFSETLAAMIRDNPNYVMYVTPLAVGYILSHPRFNIYKGNWGDLRLAGFGLDSIPHTLTALALTKLIHDTLKTADTTVNEDSPVAEVVHEGNSQPGAVSAAVLGFATLFWEFGEYMMYRHEMSLRGDITKINMQWSAEDTARDSVSNFVGWAAGVALLLLNRRLGEAKDARQW